MKSFDIFQKTGEDVRIATATGGAVTLFTSLFLVYLVLSNTAEYFTVTRTESIAVDLSFQERLNINVDILFPSSSCRHVNFDVVDTTGEEQIAIEDLRKITVSNPMAKLKEGCRVVGEFYVNKVAGNFHFALGKGVPHTAVGQSMSTDPFARTMVGAQHQHRFDMYELSVFNASHEIRRLSFGQEYPGMPPQPLDNTAKSVASGIGQYNYYLSVVPTVYKKLNGEVIRTNQYSYTQKIVEVLSTAVSFPHPGCFFYLSISPLMVQITEEHKSFLHLFTSLCAIAGCVWVVSSFIDSALSLAPVPLPSKKKAAAAGPAASSASSSGSSSGASNGGGFGGMPVPPPPPAPPSNHARQD